MYRGFVFIDYLSYVFIYVNLWICESAIHEFLFFFRFEFLSLNFIMGWVFERWILN